MRAIRTIIFWSQELGLFLVSVAAITNFPEELIPTLTKIASARSKNLHWNCARPNVRGKLRGQAFG